MMQNHSTKKFLISSLFITFTIFTDSTKISLYHQTNPEILKHVDIESPSEKDISLITACQLLEKNGTPQPAVANTIWEAITSVAMITDVLPKYNQTLTTFGYLSFMHQCTKITADFNQLQLKNDLLKFFDTYQEIFNNLNNIIKYSVFAEKRYLSLCSTQSDDNVIHSEKNDSKLYFNSSQLTALNENCWALELGPRVNQLHTLAWYTIPLLIASLLHKEYTVLTTKGQNLKKLQKTTEELSKLEVSVKSALHQSDKETEEFKNSNTHKEYQKLKEEIATLQKAIADNPELAVRSYESIKPTKITTNDLNEIKKDLQSLSNTLKNRIDNKTCYGIKHAQNLCANLQAEIINIDNLTTKNSSPEEFNRAYFEAVSTYVHSRRFLDGLLSEYQVFILSIAKVMCEAFVTAEACAFIQYRPELFLKSLILNSTISSIINLPNLLIDGIINIPTGLSKASDGIRYMYNENPVYNTFKKNLILEGQNKNDTSIKIVASAQTGLVYTMFGLIIGAYPYILYRRYNSTKELFDLIYEKQKDLVELGHLIKSMQRVNTIIKKNQVLRVLIPENKTLSLLFDPVSKKTSKDLKALIKALLSSSFQNGKTYYFTQQGKILATHHLFMRIKEKLVPYLQAYGQIDAYLSTYKLYNQYKNHPRARICLPTFINQQTPQMVAREFWHPLIDPNHVITNTLSIGTKSEHANLVITGPNAGGKTTSLMALIINIIMAQAFGIAPAKELTLTPFAKIHSYLDITTNLLEGESLFKAEVNRSKRLKESILSCQSNEKAFTIIDEIFSGTNPDVASKVGFTFAQQLGQIPHSMNIITTHFPRLTDLETETSRFVNYKVADAHIAQDGSVTYPFKLEMGKSTQNIAQHMLEVEGII